MAHWLTSNSGVNLPLYLKLNQEWGQNSFVEIWCLGTTSFRPWERWWNQQSLSLWEVKSVAYWPKSPSNWPNSSVCILGINFKYLGFSHKHWNDGKSIFSYCLHQVLLLHLIFQFSSFFFVFELIFYLLKCWAKML